MAAEKHFSVPETSHGTRLHVFLAHVLDCGLRAARRLVLEGRVYVDGTRRPPHHKLLTGSLVHVQESDELPTALPPLLAATYDYLACEKAAGLHTACIAGRTGPSLENALRRNWHNGKAAALSPPAAPALPPSLHHALGGDIMPPTWPEHGLPETEPILLTRLDKDTSGIVLAAFSPAAQTRFRQWEAAGRIDKYYLALVHGTLAAPFDICNALDTEDRKKTRVLPTASPDATRHTGVIPLHACSRKTLVIVRIKRGARHQIRAHLSHMGHPILGDRLYGFSDETGLLHLHHTRIVLPGFSALCPPPWLCPAEK